MEKAMGRLSYKVNYMGIGLDNGDNILGLDMVDEEKSRVHCLRSRDYKNVGFFNFAFIDDYEAWFSKGYLRRVKEAFKCGVSAIHNRFWFIRTKDKTKVYVKSYATKKFIACWQR